MKVIIIYKLNTLNNLMNIKKEAKLVAFDEPEDNDYIRHNSTLVYSFPLEKFVKEENSKENSHI